MKIITNRILTVVFFFSLFLPLSGIRAEEFLFAGKFLDDFDVQLQDPSRRSDVFRLEDGVLKITAEDTGWLMTKKSYCDFDFSVEVRYPEAGFADSGISLWMQPLNPPENGMKCLEIQMKTTDIGDLWGCCGFRISGDENRFHAHTEADTGNAYCQLRRLAVPEKKGPQEWSLVEIFTSKGIIKVKIDGKLVNECRTEETVSGKIGFQTKPYPQGKVPVWYRNAILTPHDGTREK